MLELPQCRLCIDFAESNEDHYPSVLLAMALYVTGAVRMCGTRGKIGARMMPAGLGQLRCFIGGRSPRTCGVRLISQYNATWVAIESRQNWLGV